MATFNLSKLKKDNMENPNPSKMERYGKHSKMKKIKFAGPFLNCAKNYEQGGEEIGGYWSI